MDCHSSATRQVVLLATYGDRRRELVNGIVEGKVTAHVAGSQARHETGTLRVHVVLGNEAKRVDRGAFGRV